MTFAHIAHQRLHNQFLTHSASNAESLVGWFGAVQAQDFPGAKWGIGQRLDGVNDAAITALYNEGKILRTHILRPTWHFVLPQDIRWMQMLTAPRVHQFMKHYYNKEGLDADTLVKSTQLLRSVLKGAQVTRKEIKEIYTQGGINADGLRLGFLIAYAELEAVICNGAMQGKQHTYALLDERAPKSPALTHEHALTELTKRFFASHGPATIKDFAWWSSLTVADIKKGIAQAKLPSLEVEGVTFYYHELHEAQIISPLVHLLPNFDEFLVGFKERRPTTQLKLDKTPTYEDLIYNIITLDGQVVGGWRRINGKTQVEVQPNLFIGLTATQQKALQQATANLQKFLDQKVTLIT